MKDLTYSNGFFAMAVASLKSTGQGPIPKVVLALLLSAFTCSAATITYNLDQKVGAGDVTGFIETNGTIGILSTSDILDWNLLLNDGTATFDLLGPLSGANSALGVVGSDLSATATQLLFNFSGSDNGYVLFQAPQLWSAIDLLCLASSNQGCSSEAVGEALNVYPDSNQFTSLTGTQAMASASSVPEPTSLLLLGTGLGVIGLAAWRRKR